MINLVFPQSGYHLRDSYEAKKVIDIVRPTDDEILVSFDVVSMYTNIPRELAMEIVFSKHEEFARRFGIGKIILKKILNFLLSDCTVFTALGKTYKQLNGLPMGGAISTNLARLVMDKIVIKTLEQTNAISFIRVYVDDTIAVVKKDQHLNVLNILNECYPSIKFTCEMENEGNCINFLNLTLIRTPSMGVILTNWYRKHFASGRLLPYYSSHKRTTIMETAVAFIRTVITLSDASFFHQNRHVAEETLRLNGFPETSIMVLMLTHYTLMRIRPAKIRNPDTVFAVFPHAICESRKIKKILHQYKNPEVIYSDSTRNSKVNFVSTRKTPTPIAKRGNMIVVANCQCGRRKLVQMTNFNENGEMTARRLTTNSDRCVNNAHAFRKFKFVKGLAYRGQTRLLANYLAWKHRQRVSFLGLGLPNNRFIPLIPN